MSRRIACSALLQRSLLAVSFTLAPAVALAEDPPFADLPSFLLERLNRAGTLEDFVAKLTEEMQRSDLDRNGLDRQDLEIAGQMEAAQYRAMMLQQIATVDLDGNGEVTKDEATRAATYQMGARSGDGNVEAIQKQVAKQTEGIMALDENGDGIVTLAEGLKTAPLEKNRNRKSERSESLLAFDPDKDGRLTVAELEQLARQAFQAVDYDHDGTLSGSEIKLLEPARQFQKEMQQAMPCDLAKPGAEELVTVLGVYDGVLQPNVTVSGQEETTQLTLVDVESGDQPLYLVLTSYQSMIWQFRGATERLARVMVIRNRVGDKRPELAGAGIIGLDPAKVTFLPPRSCGRAFNKVNSKEAKTMARVVERVTGHAVDAMLGVYSAKLIGVPSGTAQGKAHGRDLIVGGDGDDMIVLGKNSDARVIQGQAGLSLIQKEDWLGNAGNLTVIDADDVLAPGKVETYALLPHQFGLRQLVEEGKLERTNEGYRIVAPIERFPVGLGGSHGVTFILPEGMPMPGGDASHSQIILEKKAAQ